MDSPCLHGNFLLQSITVVVDSLVIAELDHWIIEPESDPGVEGVNNNLMVVRPCLKVMMTMLCKKSKGLDAAILAIVACQYQ